MGPSTGPRRSGLRRLKWDSGVLTAYGPGPSPRARPSTRSGGPEHRRGARLRAERVSVRGRRLAMNSIRHYMSREERLREARIDHEAGSLRSGAWWSGDPQPEPATPSLV